MSARAMVVRKVVTAKYGASFMDSILCFRIVALDYLHTKYARNFRILEDAKRCGCADMIQLQDSLFHAKGQGLHLYGSNPFSVVPDMSWEEESASTPRGLYRDDLWIRDVPVPVPSHLVLEDSVDAADVRYRIECAQKIAKDAVDAYDQLDIVLRGFSSVKALTAAMPEIIDFLPTNVEGTTMVPVAQINQARNRLSSIKGD